jgi:hypothetical protein
VEFRESEAVEFPSRPTEILRIRGEIDPSRHNSAVMFERGVCCSHTAVVQKSHGSRSPPNLPVSQSTGKHASQGLSRLPHRNLSDACSTTASTSPSSAACPSAG